MAGGMLQLLGLAQPQIMRVERMLVVGEELLQKLQTAKNAPNLTRCPAQLRLGG